MTTGYLNNKLERIIFLIYLYIIVIYYRLIVNNVVIQHKSFSNQIFNKKYASILKL